MDKIRESLSMIYESELEPGTLNLEHGTLNMEP